MSSVVFGCPDIPSAYPRQAFKISSENRLVGKVQFLVDLLNI